MKSNTRALVATAALFGLFTAAVEARADSKQECAAAYEKTQSLRESGQLRDARIQAALCSASTCSVYVTKDCLQWLTEVDAILPTVVFSAEDGAGANTLAVRVMVDGQPVTEKLDGEEMPLDPGEHVLRFEMAGVEAVEQKVTIQQGVKNRKLAVSFKKAPPAKLPVPAPAAAVSPAVQPPPTRAAPKPDAALKPASRSEGVPLWAWVSGGAGVVALGVSVGFAVSAFNAHSELVTKCGGDSARCPASTKAVTVPLAEQRNQAFGVSIGLGAAALVGIGAAVVGIVRAPSKASSPRTGFIVAPFGSPSGGGLTLQGQF